MLKNQDDILRDEIHAEQAMEAMKNRSPWLAELRSPKHTAMEQLIPFILATLIIYYAFEVFPDNINATMLIAFIVTLIFSVASYQNNLANRHTEALIKLLGEDNLLEIKPSGPKGKS